MFEYSRFWFFSSGLKEIDDQCKSDFWIKNKNKNYIYMFCVKLTCFF